MLKRNLAMILSLTATLPAVAQDYPPPTPAQLKALEEVNTGEKLSKVLSQTYHIAVTDKWPKNFPLPEYTSNVVSKSFSHSTKGKPTAGANLITNDPPRQVFDFYKSACDRAGWKLKIPSAKALAELSKNGEMYMLNAESGKQTIYLSCRKRRDTNGTTVSISWTKAR